MEQEISVRMSNFSAILNDLTASFERRNEYIERLCRFPLLILDDFGMERGTEYGLEQVYNCLLYTSRRYGRAGNTTGRRIQMILRRLRAELEGLSYEPATSL